VLPDASKSQHLAASDLSPQHIMKTMGTYLKKAMGTCLKIMKVQLYLKMIFSFSLTYSSACHDLQVHGVKFSGAATKSLTVAFQFEQFDFRGTISYCM
jgi:hypothetical protein